MLFDIAGVAQKYFFLNSFTVSKSLDTNQAEHFARPDLVPNCLQRLSTNDTSRQRVVSGKMN